MTALRHPNVVLFMAASTKAPRMCIVMEYMGLGCLYEVPPFKLFHSATISNFMLIFIHSLVVNDNSYCTMNSFPRFHSR
jgi:hypothetical protein